MPKMKKFSPLSPDRIHDVIDAIDPQYYYAARNVQAVIDKAENQHYRDLIARFKATPDKQKKQFIEENSPLIVKFLNEAKLIGAKGEVGEMNAKTFVVGSEGIEIISAYLRTKERNQGEFKHDVQVVKNTVLTTKKGRTRHTDIFLENEQVHKDFEKQLKDDLGKVGDGEFSKSYLVEMFGTVGGNHFVCVTVHKKVGENPVVHLLDASPDLVRNGMASAMNSIATGWCSQVVVEATCKKAFADCNLELEDRNFFANSEPLQAGGFSVCATFAYEMAQEIAKLTHDEHIELLRTKYRYPNPYGGLTEMNISLDEVAKTGFVSPPELRLDASDVFLTHFGDTALADEYAPGRMEQMKKLVHHQKNNRQEFQSDRRQRYDAIDGVNRMAEEKSIRHRYHLFEIVTNPEFLDKAQNAGQEPQLDEIVGSPYIPKNFDPHPKIIDLVKATNGIMSRYHINFAEFDEVEKECKMTFYLGAIGAQRLKAFMNENEIDKVDINEIRFAQNLLPNVDHRFSCLQKLEITIPEGKFVRLIEKMKEKGSLFPQAEHLFMPPDKSPKAAEAKRMEAEAAAGIQYSDV